MTDTYVFKDAIMVSDARINRDLDYCLYCETRSTLTNKSETKATEYKIPLTQIKDGIKQCPLCKIIYVLELI